MVYLIAVIATLFAAYYNSRMTPRLRKAILSIICVYVILIIGFRYKVGIDSIAYMHAFNKIPPFEHLFSASDRLINRFEPGFLLICSICKSFSNEFWPVQLIFATISNGCIFIFLHRYCKNAFTAVLFYFLLQWLYFSTEIMRESAAVGLFLLNMNNLRDRKWWRYYSFALLPLTLHYSAIITFFFPLAGWLRSNIVFITSCILFLMITPFVEKLNEILNVAALTGRIDQYVAGADDFNMNWRIGELIRSAFPAIAVLAGYAMCKKKFEFSQMARLQIIFCMGAFAIPLIFNRFANYTTIFITVGAADLMYGHVMNRWLRTALVAFIILTQSYYYYSMYNRWFPYVSIFYPRELVYRNNIYRHSFIPWLKFVHTN